MLEPPSDTCTISRKVVSSEKRLLLLLAETGAVDHVPTQCASELLARAEMAMKGIMSDAARNSRAERRIVRAMLGKVYWR